MCMYIYFIYERVDVGPGKYLAKIGKNKDIFYI